MDHAIQALQTIVAYRRGDGAADALRGFSPVERLALSRHDLGADFLTAFATAEQDLRAWCFDDKIIGRGRRVIGHYGQLDLNPENLSGWWSSTRRIDVQNASLIGDLPCFRFVELRRREIVRCLEFERSDQSVLVLRPQTETFKNVILRSPKSQAVMDACSDLWPDKTVLDRLPSKERRVAIRRWWQSNEGPTEMSDRRMDDAIKGYLTSSSDDN